MKCPSCNQNMQLMQSLGVKPRGRFKSRYNIKRYYCSLCEIQQSQFGSESRDEEIESEALEEAKAELEGYKSKNVLKE